MNNGYAKIGHANGGTKRSSRSIDSSDSKSFPETQQAISKTHLKNNQINITATIPSATTANPSDAEDNNETLAAKGTKTGFGQVLRRNSSVSSASSSRFKFDHRQQSSALEIAMKKVFSLRRCSSVSSDRYSRIYDQTATLSSSSPIDDNDDGMDMERKNTMPSVEEEKKRKKQRKSGKILQACKRIFGL